MPLPIVIDRFALKRSFNPGTVPESLAEGEPFIQMADRFWMIGDGVTAPASLPRVPFKPEADLLAAGSPLALALAGKASGGANSDITSFAGLTDSLPPAARTALERYLSSFIDGLPKSDSGLAVGKLWNNGGMPCRVEASS